MDVWIVWLVAACVLGVGEMHQGGFYLAPFAFGAALAASSACSASARRCRGSCSSSARRSCSPRCARWLAATGGCRRRFAPARRRWSGSRAIVLERIANDEGVGCVKIDGGEVWTARSYDEDEVIEAGERVEVVEIKGATALVMH